MAADIYIALLHYPVLDKSGRVITTAVTNLDLHDIARLSRTYGLKGYYVVQPLELQRRLVAKLISYWTEGGGREYNSTRRDAFERVRLVAELGEALAEIKGKCGAAPRLIGTSARRHEGSVGYEVVKEKMEREPGPWMICLGTGWGIEPGYLSKMSEFVLDPLRGKAEYNHLSVRTAAAIILDRLVGEEQNSA